MKGFDTNEIIMKGFDTNEIIKKLLNSLLQRYQKGLEESMRGRDFVFNYIFHKTCLLIKIQFST